jgi:glutamine synthetase
MSGDGGHPLTELAQHYLAGQLQLAPEFTALYAPFINSYKRYVAGAWAPLNATWGFENRTCAVRAIPGRTEQASHIELRVPGADTNPYIAMAAALASGLWGISNRVKLPEETKGDATALGEERAPALPRSLEEAALDLRSSAIAKELLGPEFIDHYLRTRQWEVERHQRAVTDWEMARYFEAV